MNIEGGSLDQMRLSYASSCVKEVAAGERSVFRSYRSRTKGVGNLIMNDGLIGAVVFLESKAKNDKGVERLVLDLSRWIAKRFLHNCKTHDTDERRLPRTVLDAMVHASSTDYMRMTEETMQLVRWLRQLVDVYDPGRIEDAR
ncbi:CRISPR type III-B/RAMP module-associated protein Cmr5 [Ferrithrix thermotolerans DSM 19514]|uniref:CRISPR type III-B/RAMP module-associated protein Cmr5 n=1 Tax=Ferrithrix thermotolerans DSM 19514 TaxID=1121881 RepID=A0A1M4XNF2_9ACTN|nr:type III-B CRISPR module-associated protein Cmr5 [Ferrithrix thermotolerans]SHE94961.1 CRISPR type III-B/RAMP module-associated protein Cmr5 [Ferrithrix thermotolerans DSM 19514]